MESLLLAALIRAPNAGAGAAAPRAALLGRSLGWNISEEKIRELAFRALGGVKFIAPQAGLAPQLDDSPLDLGLPGGIYQPRSYDGTHVGPVSVRTALAASMNIPALKAAQLLGVETFLGTLRRLGV